MTDYSLQASEKLSAKGATAPRVSLKSMEDRIRHRHSFVVGDALAAMDGGGPVVVARGPLDLLTVCVLVLDNGWTLVGKSAPASPENFDPDKGEKFAYEDAIRQLWPLEGYLLRDRLAAEEQNGAGQDINEPAPTCDPAWDYQRREAVSMAIQLYQGRDTTSEVIIEAAGRFYAYMTAVDKAA